MTTLAQEFTEKWRPIVTPIAQKYGINPDHVLTQIAQESWWGTRTPKGSHNYAGIQDFRKKSDGVMASDAGRQRKFRKFVDERAFVEHYVNMLSRLYPKTVGAKSIEEFASALQDGQRKYAESSQYKQHLGEVYHTHYGNGQPTTPAQPSGQTQPQHQVTQSMLNTDPAVNGGFALSMPKQANAMGKDPYEEMWGVKAPKQPYTPQAPKLTTGYQSPYKPGSYKFNWEGK